MSGLLDKAKSASSDEKTPTEKKTQSATLLSKANTAKANTANAVVVQQDGPDIPMTVSYTHLTLPTILLV